MMPRKRTIFTVLGIVLFFANLAIKPSDQAVPPSRFIVNQGFSIKYQYYLEGRKPDVLIMGNSRHKAGIDPAVLSNVLSGETGKPLRVHSLSIGSGYFPWYHAAVTELLDGRLPKTLVLGVSPRDFNRWETRSNKVKDRLIHSSGYRLMNLRGLGFYTNAEAVVTDVLAILFPALFYRSRVEAMLVPDWLIDYASPTPGRDWDFWRSYVWQHIKDLPYYKKIWPSNWDDYFHRISAIPRQLADIWSWRPSTSRGIRADGGRFPRKMAAEERKKELAEVEDRWRKVKETDFDKIRYGYDGMCSHYTIDRREKGSQRNLFRFLEEKGVEVYLVMLPAIWLEGCENNRTVNEKVLAHLQ